MPLESRRDPVQGIGLVAQEKLPILGVDVEFERESGFLQRESELEGLGEFPRPPPPIRTSEPYRLIRL